MGFLAKPPSRVKAILLALLVVFLWSTSWVLIKIGLKDIPALTFAGLRYVLAALILLPLALRSAGRQEMAALPRRAWGLLILLAVLYYPVAQGTQYLGLAVLPSASVSLLLNLSPVAIVLLAILLLGERPGLSQWLGVALNLIGTLVYFLPGALGGGQITGMLIVLLGMLSNALSTVLGRELNGGRRISPVVVTGISMGVGSVLLLAAGVIFQGLPQIGLVSWLIIGWLALVNTAVAFTLWNYTQQTLTAAETGLINNLMLPLISILAWIFLGEGLGWRQILGLLIAIGGVVLVQMRPRKS
ncbi:MAG TPA: DMT family transporter [Anaerolineaceae bacterium]|nr:DMT family transporter [Anaerolineaceae bacterium]